MTKSQKAAKPQENQRVAYLYSRISSKKQLEGRGLKVQKQNGEALCERRGWQIDKSVKLVDEGKSGFSGRNQEATAALGRFLTLVNEGRVKPGSVLVIDQLDRLSREQIGDAITLFNRITKAGIAVATVDPEALYESLEGPSALVVVVEFLRANSESQQKRRRQRDSWADRRKDAREGKHIDVSRYPGWLEKTDTGFQVVEQYADAVRKMFSLALEGMGCPRIAATLNSDKVPFWGRSKQGWNGRLVHDILRGRSVLGEWRVCHSPDGRDRPRQLLGDPIPGFYPVIIEESQWLMVQAGLDGRRQKGTGPAVRNRNLFSGLLTDALHGCGMYVTDSNGTPMLKSLIWQQRENMKRGTVPSVELGRLESVLAQMVMVMPQALGSGNDDGKRLKQLSAEESAASERMRTLQARYAEGSKDTPEYVLELMDRLDVRRKQLRADIQTERLRLADRPSEAAGQLTSLWQLVVQAEPEEHERLRERIRGLIREVVQGVYVAVHHGPTYKRHHIKSMLVELHYHNGTVQQCYSPPAVDVLQEYWSEELFVWDRSEQQGKRAAKATKAAQVQSATISTTSVPYLDTTIEAARIEQPAGVPLLKDGITAERLASVLRVTALHRL